MPLYDELKAEFVVFLLLVAFPSHNTVVKLVVVVVVVVHACICDLDFLVIHPPDNRHQAIGYKPSRPGVPRNVAWQRAHRGLRVRCLAARRVVTRMPSLLPSNALRPWIVVRSQANRDIGSHSCYLIVLHFITRNYNKQTNKQTNCHFMMN